MKRTREALQSILLGMLLAVTLILTHKVCFCLFRQGDTGLAIAAAGFLFAVVILLFLKSRNIPCLLIKGFTGLFFLFVGEIVLLSVSIPMIYTEFDSAYWLVTYMIGFWGSMAGLVFAIILTLHQFQFKKIPEVLFMKTKEKRNLLIYAAVTAVSFTYLVLPENAGVSVPLFTLLQAVCLWFCVPDRKRLWLYVPVVILSCNAWISGNPIWRLPNLAVCLFLYSAMFLNFDFRDTSLRFLSRLVTAVVTPLRYFPLPAQWCINLNREKAPVVKRILRAVLITIPAVIILILLLGTADLIFSQGAANIFSHLWDLLSFNVVVKIIAGLLVGLYLFGVVYTAYLPAKTNKPNAASKRGDLILINIFLTGILLIYTIFVVIQFRYLFAGGTLPYGLSYTEYARKGFFELLALTGINIVIILTIVHLTKTYTTK